MYDARTVQLSVQDWLAAAQQKTNMAEESLRLVAARFPNGEHENRARCDYCLTRVQSFDMRQD